MLVLALLASTACIQEREDEPESLSFVHYRNVDAYGDLTLFASNHPGLSSGRTQLTDQTSPNGDLFWVLEGVETGPDALDITLSVDFDAFGGCRFTGTSNPFQGELTEGSCVLPTPGGHVYFQLGTPATYQTAGALERGTTYLYGRWLEERDGYLLTGDGALYVRQHDQNTAIGTRHGLPDPAEAAYRDPFTHGGRCVFAGIHGTGTRVDGDPEVCRDEALEWGGEGFSLYVDDGARLSFVPLDVNEPDQRIQGVPSPDGERLTAFTGVLSGPNTRYDLDFEAGTAAWTNTFLHTRDTVSALCTVVWEGPLDPC